MRQEVVSLSLSNDQTQPGKTKGRENYYILATFLMHKQTHFCRNISTCVLFVSSLKNVLVYVNYSVRQL